MTPSKYQTPSRLYTITGRGESDLSPGPRGSAECFRTTEIYSCLSRLVSICHHSSSAHTFPVGYHAAQPVRFTSQRKERMKVQGLLTALVVTAMAASPAAGQFGISAVST